MKRDNGQGMFTMDLINEIAAMRDLAAAKVKVAEAIKLSSANADNKEKGYRLINQSRTINTLVIGMANFSLSHMGLATV